jgi:glycine dehydrogenase subunit 2
MIEPTETESKATLDEFIAALRAIYNEAKEGTVDLTKAPYTTKISRVDETLAARNPILRWQKKD